MTEVVTILRGDMNKINATNSKEFRRGQAVRLSAENSEHTDVAANFLKDKKIGAMWFNGIYGLFANADDVISNDRILNLKDRASSKHLVLVIAPEYLHEFVDFSKTSFTQEQVISLQKHLHALGVILPASDSVPGHLTSSKNKQKTVLSIWTEYSPLRKLIENFRKQGGKALAGTSANRKGHPTHFDTEEVLLDFGKDVDFTLEADHSKLPEVRKRSTSIIDLTGKRPRLHRYGNVTPEEINEALQKFGFPELKIEKDKILHVVPRAGFKHKKAPHTPHLVEQY